MKASISVGVGDRHAHEKRTVQNPGRDTHTHVCKTAVLVVEEEEERKLSPSSPSSVTCIRECHPMTPFVVPEITHTLAPKIIYGKNKK
jgi:hypothetical protein